MRYTVVTIRAHDDEKFQWKFVVRGPSIKHKDYGRVFSYVLNEAGEIRVFDTEGDAWGCASAVNRWATPN